MFGFLLESIINLMNTSDKSGNQLLKFSWTNIVQSFSENFCRTFSTNAKAHFDCPPPEYTVVDSVRHKWCELLLMDALLFFLTRDEFNATARRAFNQTKVLYQSIMKEMKTQCNEDAISYKCADRQHFMHYIPNYTDNGTIARDASIEVSDIANTRWSSLQNLRNCLETAPTFKSRHKYLGVIDMLFTHSAVAALQFDMESMLKVVIFKTICVFNSIPLYQLLLLKYGASVVSQTSLQSETDKVGSQLSKKRKHSTINRDVANTASSAMRAKQDSKWMECRRLEVSAKIAHIVSTVATDKPHLQQLLPTSDVLLSTKRFFKAHDSGHDRECEYLLQLFVYPQTSDTITNQHIDRNVKDINMYNDSTVSQADISHSVSKNIHSSVEKSGNSHLHTMSNYANVSTCDTVNSMDVMSLTNRGNRSVQARAQDTSPPPIRHLTQQIVVNKHSTAVCPWSASSELDCNYSDSSCDSTVGSDTNHYALDHHLAISTEETEFWLDMQRLLVDDDDNELATVTHNEENMVGEVPVSVKSMLTQDRGFFIETQVDTVEMGIDEGEGVMNATTSTVGRKRKALFIDTEC